MRRLLRAFPFTIAALVVLGGGIAFAAHSVLTSGPVPPGSPGDPAVAGKPVAPAGMPALKPAFTESAVRAYLATHGFPLGRTPSGGPPPISSVRFITREQAGAVMNGESLNEVAPGHIVCYVTFAGPIVVSSSIGRPGPDILPGQTPAPYPTQTAPGGYMVFDAATGNLLIAGFV